MQYIIHQGEGVNIEFKKAENALPKNLFDTVCAFLNHSGGSIILGVDDNKNVLGVNQLVVEQLCKEISTLSNNSNKLNPVFLLQPEVVDYDDKKLIYLFVPASSQVHRTAGNIFDRSSDGDFIISSHAKISELYLNKSTFYSENTIYPFLNESHFDPSTIQKAKNLIRNNRPNHPWLSLSQEDFFKSSGLYRYDLSTNTEGFTLASLLLFGKEEYIQSALPYYKIDAILRKVDLERYDDRITVCCNLIEAYEKLMDFIAKHLPDNFYLEGTQRLSLRDNTFREVIANSLIHREYLNPKPSLLCIYSDKVVSENANKPYLHGRVDPLHYQSFPKNPRLTLFFVQMAMAEALGTGLRKITKYAKLYSGKEPIITDEDMFRITVLLPQADETEGSKSLKKENPTVAQSIIDLIREDDTLTIASMADRLGVSKRTIQRHIQQLIENEAISHNTNNILWSIPDHTLGQMENAEDFAPATATFGDATANVVVANANLKSHQTGISQKILGLILEDNTASTSSIAHQLHLSERTIQIHIQQLIKQGLLSRVDKRVLWVVNEETDPTHPNKAQAT